MEIITSRVGWRRRPSVLVDVNRAHPLARGLVSCVPTWSPQTPIDIARDLPLTLAGTRPTVHSVYGTSFDGNGAWYDTSRGSPVTAFPWSMSAAVLVAGDALERSCAGLYTTDGSYGGSLFPTATTISRAGMRFRFGGSYCTPDGDPGTAQGVGPKIMTEVHASATDHKLYINGRLVLSSALDGGSTFTGFGGIHVGYARVAPTYYSSGYIEWFLLHNRALSDAEVWALYDPRTRWELYAPLVRRVYVDLGGGGGSVSLPTISSGSSTYAPSVTPGAVTIALPTVAAGSSTQAPSVALNLALPTIGTGSATTAPSVAPGAVTLTLPTITTGSSPHAPSVTLEGGLGLPTISAGSAPYAPSVTPGAVTVALPTLTAGATAIAPSVSPGAVTLTLPTVASGSGTYAPSVALAGLAVALPYITVGSAVSAPSVTPGPVSISLPFRDSSISLYSLGVAFGVVQALQLPMLYNVPWLLGPLVRRVEGVTYEVGRKRGEQWFTCTRCGQNFPHSNGIVVNGVAVCTGRGSNNCQDEPGYQAYRKDVRAGYEAPPQPLPSVHEDL